MGASESKDSGANKRGILGWQGLLGEEDFKTRLGVFAVLLILASAMTFVQLGFIGVGPSGKYLGYAFGLLGPVTAASLLLGKTWGALEGAAVGAVLWVHARVQPLDIIEKFFVNWKSTILLYAVTGLVLGLLFAVVTRKESRGVLRAVLLAAPCLLVSWLVALAFVTLTVHRVLELATEESVKAFLGTGLIEVQVICDFLLMSCFVWISDATVRWYQESKVYVGVRSLFRARLLSSLAIIFMVVSAVGYVGITNALQRQAASDLNDELTYVGDEFAKRWGSLGQALDTPEVKALPSEVFVTIWDGIAPETIFDGYTLNDGTFVMYVDGDVIMSNNPAYLESEGVAIMDQDGEAKPDKGESAAASMDSETASSTGGTAAASTGGTAASSTGGTAASSTGGTAAASAGSEAATSTADEEAMEYAEEELGISFDHAKAVAEIAESGEMRQMVYNSGDGFYELGYMRAVPARLKTVTNGKATYETMENSYIMLARPFSMVFESRQWTMLWTSLTTVALMVGIYLIVASLLKQYLVGPVDRTNASLAKITMGNLDEKVSEVGSVEFASLSAGINSTVDALKQYAAESARRIEQDLATARRIQLGALPRQFPAFPDVPAVDLFASMDAAKEVGGDFYDFFEVDDHTVGFLIADVSGKGIPGALFMMAAKAEIQNHLMSGVNPAEAILRANRYLCAHNEAGMFVTVWAATLDWQTGLLTYVNAGHNFPLLRHGRGGSWEWIKKKCGLFLGTFETAKYRQETISLEPGDELLLYTDGVNEAFNPAEEEYGNDRLEAFLAKRADLAPDGLVPALRADVAAWADGAEQSDDVTIVAVEYGSETSDSTQHA